MNNGGNETMDGTAQLSIARTTCSHGDDFINITIHKDFKRLIDIKISLKNFTLALTGLSHTACELVGGEK